LLHLAGIELIPQWWPTLWEYPSWAGLMPILFGYGVVLQSAEFRQLVGYMMAKFFSPKQLLTLHLVNMKWFGVPADTPM
jgi:hypothetical protein